MSMPVPTVSVDPGPDWATNLVASLSIVDSHNHSPGYGVQITPAGLDINSDLSIASNNLTNVRTVRFASQAATLNQAADYSALYEVGVDLYYNDGSGNNIRITQSGSVAGSSGTITGLPSGTASASYGASRFTFQSSTNVPAFMAVGPLVMGAATTSPHTVTFSASGSTPANYELILPLALPAATYPLTVDSAGNMALSGVINGTSLTVSGGATVGSTVTCTNVNSSGSISSGGLVNADDGLIAGTLAASAPLFIMKRFTGNLAASATTTLTIVGTVLGAIGTTSTAGTSARSPMSKSSSDSQIGFTTSGGSTTVVAIHNDDASNTNSYDVTVFYAP